MVNMSDVNICIVSRNEHNIHDCKFDVHKCELCNINLNKIEIKQHFDDDKYLIAHMNQLAINNKRLKQLLLRKEQELRSLVESTQYIDKQVTAVLGDARRFQVYMEKKLIVCEALYQQAVMADKFLLVRQLRKVVEEPIEQESSLQNLAQMKISRLKTLPKQQKKQIEPFSESLILDPILQTTLSKLHGRQHRWRLLYRGSRDGFNAQTFHQRCDRSRKTMVVCLADNGYVFGGFSSVPWAGNNGYKTDHLAYLFSLINDRGEDPRHALRIPILPENAKYAIYCDQTCGPTYGGNTRKNNSLNGSFDLHVRDRMCEDDGVVSCLGKSYNVKPTSRHRPMINTALFGGEQCFPIAEIEVFEIQTN